MIKKIISKINSFTFLNLNFISEAAKKMRIGLGLFCCVTFFSCVDFKEVTFSGIDNVKITSLSQSGVEALITVRIKNPNSVSFTVYKSEVDVTISGIDAGKANLTNNVRIKAKSEQPYTFKVKSDFSKLSLADMPKIIAMGLSKSVKIGLKGNLKGGKLLVKRSYPIDMTQSVPLNGF
ncbi:MAG: LEA type 2 family protein [Bacteroidetes bacterium]|nr:LEA type 2 family protein [Bacteroidota bacterium]